MKENSRQFVFALIIFEVIFIILFGFFVRYDEDWTDEQLNRNYAWFQDAHMCVTGGFGILLGYLKRFRYSGMGFNFFIAAFCYQWSILFQGLAFGDKSTQPDTIPLIELANGTMPYWEPSPYAFIKVNVMVLLDCEYTAAVCLISYCAIIGVASPMQILLMCFFEIIFYRILGFVVYDTLNISNLGGTITVHLFAAVYAIALSRMLFKPKNVAGNSLLATSYTSDGLGTIGTIILWSFWPSFVAGPAGENSRHMAMTNTYLSLSSSTIGVFIVSALSSGKTRLTLAHIQVATLAGGVVMSTPSQMPVHPFGALLIGFIAGIVSCLGFKYSQPVVSRYVVDVAGVVNLHIYTAVISLLASIFVCVNGFHTANYSSGNEQALYQFIGFLITFAIAAVGGLISGLIIRLPFVDKMDPDEYFDDVKHWDGVVPIDGVQIEGRNYEVTSPSEPHALMKN